MAVLPKVVQSPVTTLCCAVCKDVDCSQSLSVCFVFRGEFIRVAMYDSREEETDNAVDTLSILYCCSQIDLIRQVLSMLLYSRPYSAVLESY